MDVILLKDVAELGGKGDIVDVSAGYARNYLLPKKMAMKATCRRCSSILPWPAAHRG